LAQNPLKPNGGIAKDFEKFIADLNAQFRRLTGQTSSSSLASPGTVADVDAASAAHEARLQAGYEAGHAEGYEAGREAGHEHGYKKGYDEGFQIGLESKTPPEPEPQPSEPQSN
jgi:flagellar biosynthesis/type III secretory pathway protein FliH